MLGLRFDIATVNDILSGQTAVLLRTCVAQHSLGMGQRPLGLPVLLDSLEFGYYVV